MPSAYDLREGEVWTRRLHARLLKLWLMAVLGGGADDLQEQGSTDGATRAATDRGESAQRESVTERPGHAKGTQRVPTTPPVDDEVLELDDDVRKTEKMSANHFRAMLGPTTKSQQIPAASDTTAPPIQHEELASSGLIEQALAQIKAGARIRLKSDSDVDEDRDEALDSLRSAPSTIPMTMQQVSAIEATKESRPLLAMTPLARPAEGTAAPDDLLTTPTSEIIELKKSAPALPQMQRMPRIPREQHSDRGPVPVPRSDLKVMIVAVALIVCVFVTIAMLLAA